MSAVIDQDQDAILSILRARDASSSSIDAAALETAFADRETAAALVDWAQMHLGPDTLLSADELLQFTALEQSGKAAQFSAAAVGADTFAAVPEFSDDELRDAIAELERSTAAIAKQTETLRQQHDALGRLVAGSGGTSASARSDLERGRARAREAEGAALTRAVAELGARLDTRVAEAEQRRAGGGADLQGAAAEALRLDDKLLSSLQKLGWELEMENPEEVGGVVRLREICARLIKYAVETVRTRLDRMYLESLDTSLHSETAEASAASQDVAALQEELESLYAEILPVAQMSIEQQFLQPALKELDAKNGASLARSDRALEYVHACLDYLLDRAETLSSCIRDFQSYQSASDALISTAKAELAVPVSQPPETERSTVAQSPSRRLFSPMSPVRARIAAAHARRSSVGLASDGYGAALDELLRTLALILPSEDAPGADTTAAAAAAATGSTIAYLATTLAERRAKAADVARNVQQSLEEAAAAHTGDARRALQLVRDAVLAETPFGRTARLADGEIEASIDVLSMELDEVAARLGAVEAEMARRGGRSAKREEMVKRWGGR